MSTLSPTATSVTITWTQPEFSLPVADYTVSLTRVTGSGQVLCSSFNDTRPPVTTMATVTSMQFTGLQEFSKYAVSVTTRYAPAFGLSSLVNTINEGFTTHSTGIGAIFLLYVI